MTEAQERLYMLAQVRAITSSAIELLRNANRGVPPYERVATVKIHGQLLSAIKSAEQAFEELGKLLP